MKKIILGLVLFVSVVAFADGSTQVVDFPEELSVVLVHPDFTEALKVAKSSLTRNEELVVKQAFVTETSGRTAEVRIELAKRTRQIRQGGHITTQEFYLGEIVGQLLRALDMWWDVRKTSIYFKPAAEPSGNK